MTLKEKNKHHKELVKELEDIEIDQSYIKENESPYLVDYLYGISDIDEVVNDYLRENELNKEWIVFYRCILKKQYLEKGYDQFHYINKNIFLIRDEEDFEIWKEKNTKELEKINLNIEEELEKIITEIKEVFPRDNLFSNEEIKYEFYELLKNYLLVRKDSSKSENTIFKLDEFLKKKYRAKEIFICKTKFFSEILKINKSKISQIQKKYKGEK